MNSNWATLIKCTFGLFQAACVTSFPVIHYYDPCAYATARTNTFIITIRYIHFLIFVLLQRGIFLFSLVLSNNIMLQAKLMIYNDVLKQMFLAAMYMILERRHDLALRRTRFWAEQSQHSKVSFRGGRWWLLWSDWRRHRWFRCPTLLLCSGKRGSGECETTDCVWPSWCIRWSLPRYIILKATRPSQGFSN